MQSYRTFHPRHRQCVTHSTKNEWFRHNCLHILHGTWMKSHNIQCKTVIWHYFIILKSKWSHGPPFGFLKSFFPGHDLLKSFFPGHDLLKSFFPGHDLLKSFFPGHDLLKSFFPGHGFLKWFFPGHGFLKGFFPASTRHCAEAARCLLG